MGLIQGLGWLLGFYKKEPGWDAAEIRKNRWYNVQFILNRGLVGAVKLTYREPEPIAYWVGLLNEYGNKRKFDGISTYGISMQKNWDRAHAWLAKKRMQALEKELNYQKSLYEEHKEAADNIDEELRDYYWEKRTSHKRWAPEENFVYDEVFEID